MSIHLGYACISQAMRKVDIYTGRTLTIKSLQDKGVTAAKELALKNIDDLVKIIQYNESQGIRFYRLTSNLFPHLGNPKTISYTIEFARSRLEEIGSLVKRLGHRITMHPGQFAQLGSIHQRVRDQTIVDLTNHATIFEYMGLTPEHGSVMIIHGGGSYGDKTRTLERWEETYNSLPHNVKKYIALENDEFQYSVLDLLPLCEKLQIPLCIDYFHHEVMKPGFDIFDAKLNEKVMRTWKLRGIKPKCHWSNQAPDARRGTHADCVKSIPQSILSICIRYDCDIMIEAKNKDLCVLKMYKKHFDKCNNGRVEWYLKTKYNH